MKLYYRLGWLIHPCAKCGARNSTVCFWRYNKWAGWLCALCAWGLWLPEAMRIV